METTAADGAVTVEYKRKTPFRRLRLCNRQGGRGHRGFEGTVSISLPWGYYRVLESDWGGNTIPA